MPENISRYNETVSEITAITLSGVTLREKFIGLKNLLERICRELTASSHLQFPTLFSRIVYICQQYDVPKPLEWALQHVRAKSVFLIRNEQHTVTQQQFESAAGHIVRFAAFIYCVDGAASGSEEIPAQEVTPDDLPDRLRVQVKAIHREEKLLVCQSDGMIEELLVRYDVSGTNDMFNSSIERLWVGAQLNLVEPKQDKRTGYIIPHFFVLEPDYLIDASALAECFQGYAKSHLHYFRKKFEAVPNSHYILMGNLANFFLDELVYAPHPDEVDFKETFLKAFKHYPFEFTSCNDIKENDKFREFMSRAQIQFENIKRTICEDFPANGIQTEKCTLEPSFYCERFGFQGRLDLLQPEDAGNTSCKIVELKSGGLPFPKNDAGRIAVNHEAQTTIYRLIIQSVFGIQAREISPMILYSAAENPTENLRLSAPYRMLEKEIINMRNLIVATEHDLYYGEAEAVEQIYTQMCDYRSYGAVPSFFSEKLTGLEKTMENIPAVEKKYFYRFVSFLSRELYIQKTGDESYFSNTGTAALWNREFRERQEAYDLIDGLRITDIDDSGNDMKIRFAREESDAFANFREGELCILYPREEVTHTVLTNQILKGTIAEINSAELCVRFRYKQKNKSFLESFQSWVIEHDRLDHAYNNMFRGLYSFLLSSAAKKSLLLGMSKPQSVYNPELLEKAGIGEKREAVIRKALSAEDYFLIVGPPGTGKTSVFAKRLIEELYTDPACTLLVIAYTNRAVDELCEAINRAFGCENGTSTDYIRVGTELSCNPLYRHRLLQNISRTVQSRKQLREIIRQQRIYVGTLASITGKPELFDLKKFDIAIIDEASQILEPQLIGLLAKVDRFILIGDYNQLSTITLQDKHKALVKDEDLNRIELQDCRESYFERLYRICVKNGWHHAYETLTYQGRMHEGIARFPNVYFYRDALQSISGWQHAALTWKTDEPDTYSQLVSNKRIAFIPNRDFTDNFFNDKVCEGEADIVVQLSKAIVGLYNASGKHFDADKSLGIITPYRNQIALIRHKLEQTGISELIPVTVDTVERFQGSQRDIIIVSFCLNKPYQLDFFTNMNREGTVDRKLNVAITRAREQLFLVGNESVLRQNPIYDTLLNEIECCKL